MLELFDRYDAESKHRKKLLPGAPLPPWQPSSQMQGQAPTYSRRFPLSPPVEDTTRQNTHTAADALESALRQYGGKPHTTSQRHHADYSYEQSGISREDGRQWEQQEQQWQSPKQSYSWQQQQQPTYGAYVDTSSSSQNVGNTIGTRPTIRQSKLFRMYESGNATKALLGQGGLQWNTDRVEGSYKGKTYDAIASGSYIERDYRGGNGRSGDGRDVTMRRHGQQAQQQQQQQQQQMRSHVGRQRQRELGRRIAAEEEEEGSRWSTTSSRAYNWQPHLQSADP